VKFLVDTHTFLWFVNDSPELSETAKNLIETETNDIFISIASLWEISIKTALGKLFISGSYDTIIDDVLENNIEILSINFAHTAIQNKLPFHHRDPFDRMIISQTIVENVDLISHDSILDKYLQNELPKRIW